MTMAWRPSLLALATFRAAISRVPGAAFASHPYTREQKVLITKAQRRPMIEATPRDSPVVSVVVSNYLASQEKEEGKEDEEEGWRAEEREKDEAIEDLPLSHLRDLEGELEAAEFEVAHSELSRSAITSMTCQGCGVQLQTESPSSVGFVEPRLAAAALSAGSSSAPFDLICRRCLLLKFSAPSRTRVAPVGAENLEKIFSAIRESPRATIIVVVDLLDIEGSCIPDLFSRLGPHRYVLLGNKVDQLLPDGPNFLHHWRNHLQERVLAMTDIHPDKLVSTLLVSARTGYNIESLITQLMAVRLRRQPTYIVGCANVGKSSLFNRLLNSDYSKETARLKTPEATVSGWPGTTASVLHFPVTTMTHNKQLLRNARLSRESKLESRKLYSISDPEFLKPLAGHIGRSFTDPELLIDQHQGFMTLPTYRFKQGQLVDSMYTKEVVEERFLRSGGVESWQLSSLKVCYDTPGYMSEQQLSNFLTAKENEIIQGGGHKRLLPRTFTMRPGLTLLLGGIARLEYCEGPPSILLTTQTHLPVHITESHNLDAYLEEFGAALKVPDVSAKPEDRPAALPPMVSHEVNLELSGVGSPLSDADVVFSGAGWVAVAPPCGPHKPPDWRRRNLTTSDERLEVRLRAHFPEGLHCVVRIPPLCPRAVLQRASRLSRLHEFRQPRYLTAWSRISKARKAK